MAKKDNKKSKKGKRNDPVEAVRERGKGLLEEVSSAAQRIRESFDEVRAADDIRGLRTELEALAARVAALEQGRTTAPARAAAGAARRAAPRKPARVLTPPPPKPAATDGKDKPPGAATTRTRSTATASASAKDSGGAGRRPAAAKRSTAARKPAGS
jgi:hypothetical protein